MLIWENGRNQRRMVKLWAKMRIIQAPLGRQVDSGAVGSFTATRGKIHGRLGGCCSRLDIPFLKRTHAEISIAGAIKRVFFLKSESRKNGTRFFGENGPKLAHLRLISFTRIEIM